jgi:hypothetical protein
VFSSSAWKEARDIVWARRARLTLGLSIMLVNRASGLVLPATSKYLIDDVIGKQRVDLLWPLALAGAALPRNGRSRICGAGSRRTSPGCPSAISTRRRPAC